MGDKNNYNNKNKTKNNDERQRQLREERERRRREAGRVDDAPVLGTQRLFAEARRGANPSVDVNVGELFASPVVVSASSPAPPPQSITSAQVEEALAIASATALPEDDDDDLLFGDDGGVDVSDAVLSSDQGEGQMDIDHDDDVIASPSQGNRTRRVHVDPKEGEVVVEGVREWTVARQKDGSTPSSVRDISIQADFGGASIERHRRYLRASRNRQRKRNLAKKRAVASETTPPTPDTGDLPPPSLRQPGGNPSTSFPAPVAPAADNSRDREVPPPAKTRKMEDPPKKKELWWQTRKAARKEKKASQQAADQASTSSGVASTPRRKIQLVKSNSTGSSRKSEVPAPKNEDLRQTLVSRRQSRTHSRSSVPENAILPPATQALVQSIVEGLSASLDRRFRRQSPSPQPSCSRRSSGRRSRCPSYMDESTYRSFYDDESEEEEDRRDRSRSRSRSRGRSRQRQTPPSRGKGKGRGKGRGK